jgi:hypothetical protein
LIAAVGLAAGGVFGIAGAFAPSAPLRGLAWGLDGVGLVTASAILSIWFYRRGQDLMAAGFLVFLVGQSLILSGAAMDLAASAPSFGAGASLWAVALLLVSFPTVFPPAVRALGALAALLFVITAVRIFGGAAITPLSSPLPFYAYPVLVTTMGGWIWTLLKAGDTTAPDEGS